jgi:DNA invertase Pin-like site-specific DNA recombinase
MSDTALLLVRNSTAQQIGNYRSLAQHEDMAALLRDRHGFTHIDIRDEQGVSGKDLSRRPVASRALEDLKTGRYGALAVIDVGRASRDPDGIDARIFRKACREARVLFITASRAYDFRRESDNKLFDVEAMVAGWEWQSIRQRMWQGRMKRAELAPLILGHIPLGYRPVWAPLSTGRSTKTVRSMEKDPEAGGILRAVEATLDACKSLTEAAWRLNREGHIPPGHKRGWDSIKLRRLIDSPYYFGRWTLGRWGRDPELWDQVDPEAGSHAVPHLAWFPAYKQEAWKRKFPPQAQPAQRFRLYDHPVLPILRCPKCGGPMHAAGKIGYGCARRSQGDCRFTIGEKPLLRAAAAVVPEALARVREDPRPGGGGGPLGRDPGPAQEGARGAGVPPGPARPGAGGPGVRGGPAPPRRGDRRRAGPPGGGPAGEGPGGVPAAAGGAVRDAQRGQQRGQGPGRQAPRQGLDPEPG